MTNKRILTIAENRIAVRDISQHILERVAPDEAALPTGFLDATIAATARGQVFASDSSDVAGGLGGVDLAMLIVVPAVVTVLTNLLTQSGVESITALKRGDIVAYFKSEDVTIIFEQAGGKWNKRKSRQLIDVFIAALNQILDDGASLHAVTGGGIPSDIFQDLYATLLHCGPFASDATLRNVFVDARIMHWRDQLPQATNQEERIRAVIDYLHDRYNTADENALVLLLEVLRDNTNASDVCHEELADTARILSNVVGK